MSLTGLSDKPHELGVTAMIRAQMCESLASKALLPHPEMYFTVGLLSTLDAFLDQPIIELTKNLSLSHEIVDALLHYTGLTGLLLHTTLLHEQGQWFAIRWEQLAHKHINAQVLEDAYLEAVLWARELSGVSSS